MGHDYNRSACNTSGQQSSYKWRLYVVLASRSPLALPAQVPAVVLRRWRLGRGFGAALLDVGSQPLLNVAVPLRLLGLALGVEAAHNLALHVERARHLVEGERRRLAGRL